MSTQDLTTLAGLNGTGNAYTITISDTSATAAALTALDAKTTVAVTASAVTTLSGDATEVIAAYAADTAGTLVLDNDEAVSVSGSVSVTDANTISSKTGGVVTASIAS